MRGPFIRLIGLLALLWLLLPTQAHAQDFKSFSSLPVLHEGRLKPMESFARSAQKQLSGREEDTLAWLIETLLDPEAGQELPVLSVKDPALRAMLDLPMRESKLYSYSEVSRALAAQRDVLLSALETEENQLSTAQKNLIILQDNVIFLSHLLGSLHPFLPLTTTLEEEDGAAFAPYAGQTLTFLDTLTFDKALTTRVRSIAAVKGENFERYSESELRLVQLGYAVEKLRASGALNDVLRVIPVGGGEEWLSPWAVIAQGAGTPEIRRLFSAWTALVEAYHSEDRATWSAALDDLNEGSRTQGGALFDENAFKAELFYNAAQPFKISFGLYGLGLALLLAGFVFSRPAQLAKPAFLLLCIGAGVHIFGLVLRCYILGRPPVSTLYESVLFVGALSVIIALWAHMRDKNTFWLPLAGLMGIALHLIGFSYNQGGDSLLKLSAVLNTNFWLATHVLCITASYAFCLLTSALAHFALTGSAVQKSPLFYRDLFSKIHVLALLSLMLAATGTVLGGIWADQSWGRFWGWDPKENGALLICLWLIWVLHGRVAGQMNRLSVCAGLAFLSVIVMLSWFGVNLLSVGLHSYGFTDSAAWILAVFITAESLIIGFLYYKNKGIRHG